MALDGFLIVATSDGTILYSTENISGHLGFHQVDLVHRCLYGIVHPDDHHELKVVLEQTLVVSPSCQAHTQVDAVYGGSRGAEERGIGDSTKVSFLCRMKCFNGTSTGFVKMHCCGTMQSFPGAIKSSRTSCQVLFLAFRPFTSLVQDTDLEFKQDVFWSKHEMDLSIKILDSRANEMLGFDSSELEGRSLYELIHPNDIAAMYACHKTLIDTDDTHTMYFRLLKKDSSWLWLHTRAKVMTKNSRKNSIILTHCPVREMDSSYLQQEARARTRYGLDEYMKLRHKGPPAGSDGESSSASPQSECSSQNKRRWTSNDTYVVASQSPYKLKDDYSASLHSPHGACPSSYHQSADRHSPVYPSTYALHRYQKATHAHGSEKTVVLHEREPPSMNVNFYDYAQVPEDFVPAPLHPSPQPHPALSMYQMVAHLPPEMYDVDSYRKHTFMLMESHGQLPGGATVPNDYLPHHQYRLPLTPQTSPQSFYSQSGLPVPTRTPHYPEHIRNHAVGENVQSHTPETLSPPPSPNGSNKAACMYSQPKAKDRFLPSDSCCKGEHYASYVIKLLDGVSFPCAPYPNGSGYDYPHGDQYSLQGNCVYGNYQYAPDIELKPFQRMEGLPQPKATALSSPHGSLAPYADDLTGSNNNMLEYGYHSNILGSERFLPCPMANTRNGCLAPKLLPSNEVRVDSPESLPPIGSFLDFLNEDMPLVEETC